MPALMPTNHHATIIWLGHVASRAVSLQSAPVDALDMTFAGPVGEDHAGLTRRACSRVSAQYSAGTEIRNTRQISLVSAEQLAEIADGMDLDAIDPAWLGASVVVSGLPDFSHMPPSARLQAPDGATLVVDMQNRPCRYPAEVIEAAHPGKGKLFKSASSGRRGVTAWVEAEGRVAVGDRLLCMSRISGCGWAQRVELSP